MQNAVVYVGFLQCNCDVELLYATRGRIKQFSNDLGFFSLNVTELRMKNLALGFTDMSKSSHDLM